MKSAQTLNVGIPPLHGYYHRQGRCDGVECFDPAFVGHITRGKRDPRGKDGVDHSPNRAHCIPHTATVVGPSRSQRGGRAVRHRRETRSAVFPRADAPIGPTPERGTGLAIQGHGSDRRRAQSQVSLARPMSLSIGSSAGGKVLCCQTTTQRGGRYATAERERIPSLGSVLSGTIRQRRYHVGFPRGSGTSSILLLHRVG